MRRLSQGATICAPCCHNVATIILYYRRMLKQKQKPATSDLFAVTDCEDCNSTGQVDTTPKGATYERLEDCDICNGTGMLQ